jgi:hypothetical protein
MHTKKLGLIGIPLLALAVLIGITPAHAQSNTSVGKLHITVSPKQAYVFVDGKAIRDGSQTIQLTTGEHEVTVSNYGYVPQTQKTNIVARKTTALDVTLQQSGEKVSGPFGDIEFKGHPRAAVLLNGTTPDYFVGHVDEFDNNFIWHQWLLVRPGTYQVTVTREGNTIWSGPVAVKAGQRVIVNLNDNGKMKTKDFPRGMKMGPQPRFDAGIASARVPVAPVTAMLDASQTQEGCGQSSTLKWTAANAVATSITPLGRVPTNGDRTVSPTQTTKYELVAKGPGGIVTRDATIQVNPQPTAMLTLSTPDVTYHKIGDKVVEQGSATLTWTTSNGSHVTIQPLGDVAAEGAKTVEPAPTQMTTGPVSQDVMYTLEAKNACGGTATRTAMLHITGSIDPAPPVTLASVFYPTNYPVRRLPRVGLVRSQKKELAQLASTFEKHEEYDAPNHLVVVGHADVRGPEHYNLELSRRRAELVKRYLVSQGISASVIEVRAEGKDHELNKEEVKKLQAQDPEAPPKWMKGHLESTWMAYNRRVDILREPAGQQSTEAYPNDAPSARIVWERPQPNLKKVESLASLSASMPNPAAKTVASLK